MSTIKHAYFRNSVGHVETDTDKLVSAFLFHRNSHGIHKIPAHVAISRARNNLEHGLKRYGFRPFAYGANQRTDDNRLFIEKPLDLGLRFLGYAHDLVNLGHKGWFTDNNHDESVRGVVYQLPSRKGEARVFVGYNNPWNGEAHEGGAVCLSMNVIRFKLSGNDCRRKDLLRYEEIEEASRDADRMAEDMAEREREYQSAWQHGNRYGEILSEISEMRTEALNLLANLKQAKKDMVDVYSDADQSLFFCANVRKQVSDLRDKISDLREKALPIFDGDYIDDWLTGFNRRDKKLVDAFNDGLNLGDSTR